MLFTHKKESLERDQLLRIADSLDQVTKRLDTIEDLVDKTGAAKKARRKSSRLSVHGEVMNEHGHHGMHPHHGMPPGSHHGGTIGDQDGLDSQVRHRVCTQNYLY